MDGLTFIVICIFSLFTQIELEIDRPNEFRFLNSEYVAMMEAHHKKESRDTVSDARDQPWPGLVSLPKFIALAQANPDDETAFQCCVWIINRCGRVGITNKEIYDSDTLAWEIITKHHGRRPEMPLLCLQAARHHTPAREKFLRDLPEDWTQTVEVHGFAILSLAELLARKYETAISGASALSDVNADEMSPEWERGLTVGDAEQIRLESREVFQKVLVHYARIPVDISTGEFRDVKTLGERATKSLRMLETLQPALAGSNAIEADAVEGQRPGG